MTTTTNDPLPAVVTLHRCSDGREFGELELARDHQANIARRTAHEDTVRHYVREHRGESDGRAASRAINLLMEFYDYQHAEDDDAPVERHDDGGEGGDQ